MSETTAEYNTKNVSSMDKPEPTPRVKMHAYVIMLRKRLEKVGNSIHASFYHQNVNETLFC